MIETTEVWDAFLSRFENRYVHQKLRQHAVDHAEETENKAVSDAGCARGELASRAVQSLYTLAMRAKSLEDMRDTVNGIRDARKKALCLNLISTICNRYENQAVKAVGEEPVCPAIEEMDLKKQWAWKQFYMVEMLSHVIRLQAKGRQETSEAGGAG